MDPQDPAPTGLTMQKTLSEKRSLAGDGIEEEEKNEQVIQKAEDNPRAVEPNGIAASDVNQTPAVDVSEIPVIPPTFSGSSWARRNARVQKAKRLIPSGIRSFMAYTLILTYMV